jgi:hypothetical protein
MGRFNFPFTYYMIDAGRAYSGKRLKASTMYSRIKKNRSAENSFLFYQNVRIRKPVSLHHLLQIWPEMFLQVHSSKRVFHGTSRAEH